MRKHLRRLPPFLLVLFLVLAMAGDTVNRGGLLGPSKPFVYSVVAWEVKSFPKKWTYAFTHLFSRPSQTQKIAEVRRYFALTDQINQKGYQLQRAKLGADAADPQALAVTLEQLEKERTGLNGRVEVTLEEMISGAMREQGLSRRFFFWKVTWPPVDFKLSSLPNVIALSPRDRIELLTARLLRPDMSTAELNAVEAAYTRMGYSSVIEDIGGVATYPSLVNGSASLQEALHLGAHEWMHHYLFFQPLGQHYWDNGRMTAINETTADLVGVEIGRQLYRKYFATPEELAPPPARPRPPVPDPSAPPPFSFTREMRTTRLQAEALLKEGKVDAAEAYMRERSRFLAEHGYVIPVLNQAYFAFHGSYTESAESGSVNPLGGQIRGLRTGSTSVGAFVQRMQKVTSHQEFLKQVVPAPTGTREGA